MSLVAYGISYILMLLFQTKHMKAIIIVNYKQTKMLLFDSLLTGQVNNNQSLVILQQEKGGTILKIINIKMKYIQYLQFLVRLINNKQILISQLKELYFTIMIRKNIISQLKELYIIYTFK